MIKNNSIVSKMAFFIVGISLMVIGLSLVLYMKFNVVVTDQILKHQENSLMNSKIIVERFFKAIDNTLMDITMNKNLATMLKNQTEDPLEIINNRLSINEELFLSEDKFIRGSYIALFISQDIPFSQHLTKWSGEHVLTKTIPKGVYSNSKVTHLEWYKKALDNKGTVQSFITDDGDSILFVSAVQHPYLRMNNFKYTTKDNGNKFTSVIALELSSWVVEEMIKTSQLIPDSVIQLYDNHQQVIYTYPKEHQQLEPVEDYIITDTHLTNGWSIKAHIPVKNVKKKTNFVKYYIGLVTLIILMLVILFASTVSKTIAKPILKLSKIMKYTNMPKPLPEDKKINKYKQGKHEIGVLYNSYERMVKQLNASLEVQKDAEYKALQAQINPHFIYNVLDSINWLALCKGQDQIAEMTTTLSNILRYSINKPNTLTTLSEEVAHVKDFVFIESIRYEDAFKVVYDIWAELETYKVPKFILQPLVENAIRHGVMKKREGIIEIHAQIESEHVHMWIVDTGVGSDVEKINNYLASDADTYKDTDGVGIKNVHERVQRVYGQDYGLKYEVNNYGGTTVHIFLPMEWEEL